MSNFFVGFLVLVFVRLIQSRTYTETCVWNVFRAACEEADKVLVIELALYGRMRNNSCFNLEEGEKPCSTDVRLFVERQCAGRQQCQINLPSHNHNLMNYSSTCDRYRQQFLEVEFQCEQVYTAPEQSCVANQSLIVNGPTGYLANIITDQTHKGSSSCPWKFQLRPDQTVHLSLLDFGIWMESTAKSRRPTTCRVYARIRDSSSTMDTPICGGDTRQKFLLSATSEVQIAVVEQENDDVFFLLKYQVFDCPALDLPAGAVVNRSRNGIRVLCPGSLQSFELRCVEGEWTPRPECSTQPTLAPTQPLTYSCSNLVFPSGTSYEKVNMGIRISCLNGDIRLIQCIGGRWIPDLPKNCTDTASQTEGKGPTTEAATASSELSKVLNFAFPSLVAFVTLVIVVVVAVVLTVRRKKRPPTIEMNSGQFQQPVDNKYDFSHRPRQQDDQLCNNRAKIASEIYEELDASQMLDDFGVGLPPEAFMNRFNSLPMQKEKLGFGVSPPKCRGGTLPILMSQAEFQKCSTTGTEDTTYLVPVKEDCPDITYAKISRERNP